MGLVTEREIKAAYSDGMVAARYFEDRFASELNRLLHERQVASVQRAIDCMGPSGSILEIAPGPGRLTRDLRTSHDIIVMDFNEGMIAQGRPVCPSRVSWVRGDGFRLPFSGQFGLIYSFRFVRHFRLPDRERLYAEICRCLRPGGYFVMDAVNEQISRPLREAFPEQYPIYDELYRPEDLRKELAESGLEVIQLEPVQRCYRWQYRSQVLLGPRSGRLNRWMIRSLERLSRRDGLEWVVTCRRA